MYSEHIQTKAARLVLENRVFHLFQGNVYSIFVVEGDTGTYQVHIREDGTPSCTCPYWTYRAAICSHILACQIYSDPPRSEALEEPEEELSPEEIERLVSGAADLFDPATWR